MRAAFIDGYSPARKFNMSRICYIKKFPRVFRRNGLEAKLKGIYQAFSYLYNTLYHI